MVRGLVVVVAITVIAATGCGGDDKSSAAPASTAVGAELTFSEGLWEVGKQDYEISAGTYRAPNVSSSGCYWARLNNLSDPLRSIIANANVSAAAIVTIKPTDKRFESKGCGTWTSDLRRTTKSQTRFGPGTYLVGVDVLPGTYVAKGGTFCSWVRLRNFTGESSGSTAIGLPSGRAKVTVCPCDRGFQSAGCGTWHR